MLKWRKDERLARIRRNQQNCRDRKRNRVIELEEQVKELLRERSESTIEEIPRHSQLSQQLHHTLDENAAFRRLLKAIGMDEQAQQQYLETTKNYGLDLESFQGERYTFASRASTSKDSQVGHVGAPTIPLQQRASSFRTDSVGMWQMPTRQSVPPLSQYDLDSSLSSGTLPQVSTDGFFQFDERLLGIKGSHNALPEDSVLFSQSPQWESKSPEILPISAQSRDPSRKPTESCTLEGNPGLAEITPTEQPSNACCLTDADVAPAENDSTTLCSIALSLVMQHNKKRLTTTQLDDRLRVGYRGASNPAQGCRIQNNVLFSVLADICT